MKDKMKTYTVKAIYTWDNWMEDATEGELETSATGDALFIEAEELVREWGYKPMRPGPNGDGGYYHLYSEEIKELDRENSVYITTVENVIIITVCRKKKESKMKDKELNTLVVERDMPKTRELFNRVMKSLKTHSFSEKLPEIMTIHTETMIDIARYMLPTVTVGKSDLSWVSVPARNSIKDGYRQASMKVVYVEPSRMWSTDGVSIFVVYDHDQKTMGCLEPFSLLPIEDIEPIQIDRIINVEPNMQVPFFYKQIETVGICKTIDHVKIPGTDDLFNRKVIESFVQPGQIWELIYRESEGVHMFKMRSKKKSKRVVAAMPQRFPDWHPLGWPYKFDEEENQ